MKKSINIKYIALLIASALFSCTSSNDFAKGKQQLEQQGYANIEYTGYDWFCCSDKDEFSTGFKCKDKNGNKVKGCFCSSLLKGVTIRFE